MDQIMDDDTPTTTGSGCNIIGLSILLLGTLSVIPNPVHSSRIADDGPQVYRRSWQPTVVRHSVHELGAPDPFNRYAPRNERETNSDLSESDAHSPSIGDLILVFVRIALAIVGAALFI